MRRIIFTSFFLMFTSLGWSQQVSDKKEIEDQIDSFLRSWNKHDFSDMKNYIADDCDFVNVVGMLWKGRENIQYAHQFFHESVFKTTPMEKRSVTVRLIKPDVAIVHLVWHIGLVTNPPVLSTPRTKPDGNYDDMATIVFLKENGKWLITAMENVVINEELAPNDPVKLRAKSKQK